MDVPWLKSENSGEISTESFSTLYEARLPPFPDATEQVRPKRHPSHSNATAHLSSYENLSDFHDREAFYPFFGPRWLIPRDAARCLGRAVAGLVPAGLRPRRLPGRPGPASPLPLAPSARSLPASPENTHRNGPENDLFRYRASLPP
jgi:hypothetical protein